MSTTIQEVKNSLIGLSHSGTINRVRNIYSLMERVAITVLTRLDPIETQREQQLTQAIHDDLQNYTLPADFKKMIDVAPVEDRQSGDRAQRKYLETFSAELNTRNKAYTIESRNGTKFIRLNWKDGSSKTLHTMNSPTDNGTISAVGSATGLKANSLYKLSGSASIEFDLVATGDGVQNTTMTAVDLEDWDEYADFIVPIYLGSTTNFTSATLLWGNDLTTKFWTPVAQTAQSDGTAVKTGWNYFLFPWTTATETGTVDPAEIDSFRLTVAAGGAISNIRVDNILVSLGRFFDAKYYSQYAFQTSAGVWINQPTDDTDVVVLSGTAYQIFLLECLVAIAQQMEGTDSEFDINFARGELKDLYQRYRKEFPSQAKPIVGSYTSGPRFKR